MKSDLFLFVEIRRVKATKMCKSRSNYPFLFLFLSRIRKGLKGVRYYSMHFRQNKIGILSYDKGGPCAIGNLQICTEILLHGCMDTATPPKNVVQVQLPCTC
jgi:hypothetical protein